MMIKIKEVSITLSLLALWNINKANAQEKLTELEEVVVSATRTSLPKKNLTQSLQVIKEQEIVQQQVTDLQEILRNVPGLNIVQTGARGSQTTVFIRGGSSDHNLVLIDGVRVNQAGGTFDFSQFPTDNIERIEVLKGPQSSLYGSDAISSVIHIITKKGRGPTKTDFSLAGGNYNTFEEKVHISGGSENGGFSFGAGRIDTDGVLNVNNRFNENSFSASFNQKLYKKLNFNVSARYQDSKYQIPTASAGDRLERALDQRNYTKRRRLILSSGLDSSLTDWWNQKLQLGLLNDDRFSTDPRDPIVDTADAQSHNIEMRHSIDYSWDFSLPKLLEMNSVFTAGIALEREFFEQTSRRITTSTTTTAIDQTRNNYAYFFQGQWDWNEIIFLTPGVRVEENESYGTEANPKISGGFMIPYTKTKIRSSYAQGIKEPTFLQNFGSAQIIPNPNLRPERVKSWEVGLDQTLLEDFIEVNVTYFHNEYKDLISFISLAQPYRNIQKAESQGIESSFKCSKKWNKNFNSSLVLAHTYLETKALENGGVGGTLFTSGQELLRRPKNRGAITFNLDHPRFNFNWNTTIHGQSIDRDFSKTPEVRVNLPYYSKTDLTLSIVVLKQSPEVRIFTKLENLFDLKYEEVYGFSAARLQFLGGVGVKF